MGTAGQAVETFPLGTTVPEAGLPTGNDRLMIAFPVLAWRPPALVLKAISKMPSGTDAKGHSRQAFVLAVDGGNGGPGARRAADLLRRKGYTVVHLGRASYPENWTQVGAVCRGSAEIERNLEIGDRMAEAFADCVLYGTSAPLETTVGSELLGWMVGGAFTLVGRRVLGKLWYADRRCTGCGLCARTCPARTIGMDRGPLPRPFWKLNCEDCNRCINVCPVRAINPSVASAGLQLVSITGLSAAGLLALAAAAPSIAFLDSPGKELTLGILAIAVVVGAHAVALGPLDTLVFRRWRRISALDGLFAASWTRKTPRYLAPRFRPEDTSSLKRTDSV